VKTLLYQASVTFEELFRSGINFKWVKPKKQFTQSNHSKVEMILREHRVAQKTLISFCIQVPCDDGQESIFKNSRLMLHEIYQDDWSLISKNEASKFEVVKITRCKMRQKDILEIEMGLKNIVLKDK
jgi:hypothetical protein